jgi:hypothetical protein
MKNAVDWIKGALAKKDLVQQFTHYLVSDGKIRAYDGRMVASCPFPYEGEFLVPGAEFEAILDRMPVDSPTIELKEDFIRVKHKRFRGDIKTLPITEFPELEISAEWVEFPDDLIDIIRDLLPFISDNATKPWAMAINILNGRLYTTNNVSVAFADHPGLEGIEGLLPVWAAEFVVARREGLTHWQLHDGYAAFKWADGSWMRTQLINDETPEILVNLANDTGSSTFEITDDWRAAYDLVTGVAKEEISLYPDLIVGKTEKSSVEHAATNIMREGIEYTHWSVPYLNKVIQAATHWQPDLYPKPVTFSGPTIKGLIVGRSG